MRSLTKWISIEELMKRWGLTKNEVLNVIKYSDIRIFYLDELEFKYGNPEPDLTPMQDWDVQADTDPDWWRFFYGDVEELDRYFIGTDDKERSEGEEKQELGRLRLEKLKWDKSIEAAIAAVQFCHKQNKQVTKKELEEHLSLEKKIKIPDSIFRKIWVKLPSKFKQQAGRPKKK